MNNMRRRRSILTLSIMLGMAANAMQNITLRNKYGLLFQHLVVLDKELNRIVPIVQERNADLIAAKNLVLKIVPTNFGTSKDELVIWFTCQVARRLVASGWKLPRHQQSLDFVQTLYNAAEDIVITPPTQSTMTALGNSVETIKKSGLFEFN